MTPVGDAPATPPAPAPAAARIVLAALLALAAWPFVAILKLPPINADCVLWILRSAPGAPGWAYWVFGTRHFNVGYRPVAALTYTLDALVAGLHPLAYRLTDLGLHLLAVLLLYLLVRRLAPRAPAWVAVAAASLFAAHPAVDEVVPYIARRSYALAAVLALAGLWLLARGLERSAGGATGRGVAGARLTSGLLLPAAVLANEGALVPALLAPLLPVCLLPPGGTRWRLAWRAAWMPLLLTGLALGARTVVLGGVGGYGEAPLQADRFLPVLAAVLGPGGLLPAGPLYWIAAPALLALILLRGAWRPGPAQVPLAWLLGTAGLVALSGSWFPRQGYLLALPLAALVALLAQSPGGTGSQRQRALRVLPPLAGALLAGCLLAASPLVHGTDPPRLAAWQQMAARQAALEAALASLKAPARVLLVLPVGESGSDDPEDRSAGRPGRAVPRRASVPALWAGARLETRGVTVDEWVFYAAAPEAGPPRLERGPDGPRLHLPPGEVHVSSGPPGAPPRRLVAAGDGVQAVAVPPAPAGVSRYLYIADATEGALQPVDETGR